MLLRQLDSATKVPKMPQTFHCYPDKILPLTPSLLGYLSYVTRD